MLSPYDQNGDGELTIEDFRLPIPFDAPQFMRPSDSVVRHFMQESVAEAFVELRFVAADQRDAFVRYFDRYNDISGRVKELKRLVPAMVNAPHTTGFSIKNFRQTELQLSPADWRSKASPVLAAAGESRPDRLGFELSADLYLMLADLAAPGRKDKDREGVGVGCDNIIGFTYSGSRFPQVIAGQTEALLQSWNEIRSSFGKYTQIECEGKGCPEEDEVHVFFTRLGKGSENDWDRAYCGR